MRDPNSRAILFKPPKSELFNWEVKTDPPRFTTAIAQGYVKSFFNDRIGRPWFFAMLSVIGIAILLSMRLTDNREGMFGLALLCSGLIYLTSYFVTTVSAQYRYFYWSGFSAYLGLVMILFAWLAHRRHEENMALSRWLQAGAILLVGVTVGLVAVPVNLPMERRVVSIEPLSEHEVTITRLRSASMPNWMGSRYEGEIASPGWRRDAAGLHANASNGVLSATIPTLHQAIELELEAGPDKGRLRIQSEDFDKTIDLNAPAFERRVLYLWPPESVDVKGRYPTWIDPVKAGVLMIACIVVLMWVSRPPQKRASPE